MPKTYYRIDEFDKVAEFEGSYDPLHNVVSTGREDSPEMSRYYVLGEQCFVDPLACAERFMERIEKEWHSAAIRLEAAQKQWHGFYKGKERRDDRRNNQIW